VKRKNYRAAGQSVVATVNSEFVLFWSLTQDVDYEALVTSWRADQSV